VTCENPAASDRRELSPRPFDPQVSKVHAACSGLFFEVSSKHTWPSKGVYGVRQINCRAAADCPHGLAVWPLGTGYHAQVVTRADNQGDATGLAELCEELTQLSHERTMEGGVWSLKSSGSADVSQV
jgi:hypothetical protein